MQARGEGGRRVGGRQGQDPAGAVPQDAEAEPQQEVRVRCVQDCDHAGRAVHAHA